MTEQTPDKTLALKSFPIGNPCRAHYCASSMGAFRIQFAVSAAATILATPALSQGQEPSFLERNLPDRETRAKLMKAAKEGDAHAQYMVAQVYLEVNNRKAAMPWFEKAAKAGVVDAQIYVARSIPAYTNAYVNPTPFQRANPAKVREHQQRELQKQQKRAYYLLRAGKQGGERAFASLSYLYQNRKDFVEAYKWARLAASVGPSPSMQARLDYLAQQMNPRQLTEAKQRAKSFIPKKERVRGDKSSGTGFFITKHGHIVTCHHVIEDKRVFHAKIGDQRHPAKLIRSSPELDLALLRIAGEWKPLPITGERQVNLGEPALTLGFPNSWIQGDDPKLSRGALTGLSGIRNDEKRYQIDVDVQHGNSGGALVDKYGAVLGVVDSGLNDSYMEAVTGKATKDVNYSIKAEILRGFLIRIPGLEEHLPPPGNEELSFEKRVANAQRATVMIEAE